MSSFLLFKFLRIKAWANVSKGKLITGLNGGRNEPLVKVSLCVCVSVCVWLSNKVLSKSQAFHFGACAGVYTVHVLD